MMILFIGKFKFESWIKWALHRQQFLSASYLTPSHRRGIIFYLPTSKLPKNFSQPSKSPTSEEWMCKNSLQTMINLLIIKQILFRRNLFYIIILYKMKNITRELFQNALCRQVESRKSPQNLSIQLHLIVILLFLFFSHLFYQLLLFLFF